MVRVVYGYGTVPRTILFHLSDTGTVPYIRSKKIPRKKSKMKNKITRESTDKIIMLSL